MPPSAEDYNHDNPARKPANEKQQTRRSPVLDLACGLCQLWRRGRASGRWPDWGCGAPLHRHLADWAAGSWRTASPECSAAWVNFHPEHPLQAIPRPADRPGAGAQLPAHRDRTAAATTKPPPMRRTCPPYKPRADGEVLLVMAEWPGGSV